MPYTNCFGRASLTAYLFSLEIEQALADYHALSQLRLRSSSCAGILYWSLNKGSPLHTSGCIDYGGRPMMSYYIVKRMFGDLVIGIYRDIDDLRVVVGSSRLDPVDGEVRIEHVTSEGRSLQQWTAPARIRSSGVTRVMDLGGYYRSIGDRTRELLHAELVVDGQEVSADTLFFCPFSEAQVTPDPLHVEVTRSAGEEWEITIEADSVAKLIEIESADRLLFSDNYFVLVPGRRKSIRVRSLEPDLILPTTVTVSSVDNPHMESVDLE